MYDEFGREYPGRKPKIGIVSKKQVNSEHFGLMMPADLANGMLNRCRVEGISRSAFMRRALMYELRRTD